MALPRAIFVSGSLFSMPYFPYSTPGNALTYTYRHMKYCLLTVLQLSYICIYTNKKTS